MQTLATLMAILGKTYEGLYKLPLVGDALVRARFADPVMDVDRMTLTYRQVGGLMQDLKVLGAHNVAAERPRGLTGKGRMQAMRAAYERFRVDGRLPASYEVVYGHAWAPDTPRGGIAVAPPGRPVQP